MFLVGDVHQLADLRVALTRRRAPQPGPRDGGLGDLCGGGRPDARLRARHGLAVIGDRVRVAGDLAVGQHDATLVQRHFGAAVRQLGHQREQYV
ncbi:MAG: hypothetical protein U1F25_13755 [Rubrivivax sp.]